MYGRGVKFWHDVWCENYALKDLYSELYLIAMNKETSVYSCLGPLNEEMDL